MRIDELFYKAFLEEMNELDNFRILYASLHPGIQFEREDPDLRRLTEAMAFFSARTRIAGLRNLNATILRFFQQFLPYLLTPLPSVAIAQAVPTRQLSEKISFPMGTELSISPDSGGTAIFRTICDLSVLPVIQTRFSVLMLPSRGFRVVFTFTSAFPRSDEIGTLNFFINHLNNIEASALMLFNIKRHLKGISVVFNEKADERSQGQPCEFSFGMQNSEYEDEHPLEKERVFFHFPWTDLYLNIKVAQPPGAWRELSICIDIDHEWPKSLVLNQDIFQPFTVPIVNLRKDMAKPLTCDGTKEQYSIEHPNTRYGFSLHSVRGIYEVTQEGMAFVKPGILSGTAPSYETEETVDAQGVPRIHLLLHYPEAFENPKIISVDARWYQPWFKEKIAERLSIAPFSHTPAGIKWELPFKPVPNQSSFFQENTNTFLHYLTLANKEILSRDDLTDILKAMGILSNTVLRSIGDLLLDIRVEKTRSRDMQSAGLLKHRYFLYFRAYNQNQEPLVDMLVSHIEKIIANWISDAEIEMKVGSSSSNQKMSGAGY